ncbi:ABC transporter ATP-binding protein [Ornithinibacillus halotolerans]|uniref:Multidrug ABC transporter ATP-binding protein n=1 Tax=Ornithinibacillus halotolerans TaxID=1274357 RepID=A0A916RX57_9BACI|nr:ABC transporter ATP-binding protein [Ornithinibacillus halotolerans]GGA74655.1 multidrug ABC transporter ATP-binding protein [Ornithinibacillus halotolerans]
MLKLENISVKYKDKVVLENLSFSANSGEIIGLVAPNGTGKTTLFNVIANYLKPNKGNVTFNGNLQYKTERKELSIHKQLVTLPDQGDLFEELSGVDHMKLYANMWKGSSKQVKEIYEELHMEGYVKKKVKTYSLGMRQRLCFAMIAAADTPIMLMDEVMNGLDVANVSLISNRLMKMKQEGKLIFIASHLLANLDLYADRVIYLRDGGIVHEQRLNETDEEFIKIQVTEEQYEKLQYALPENHLYIGKRLCCIPVTGLSMEEKKEWIEKLSEYKDKELTIGPLGTPEFYERYYHED